jgi:Tfp pilus assembly protein PilV
MNRNGATLVEVLIVTVLISAVFITLSTLLPRSARVITENRRRWLASNYATALMEQLKAAPYPVLDPTPPGNFPSGPLSDPASATPCDCSQVDFTTFSGSDGTSNPDENNTTQVDAGVVYTRKVCINLVERKQTAGVWNWVSHCSDGTSATDMGYKNIRIGVVWTVGPSMFHTEMESLVVRYAN